MKRLTYAIAALLTTSLLAIAGPPVLSWCPVAYQFVYSWRSPWSNVSGVFNTTGDGAGCKHWLTPSGESGQLWTRDLHMSSDTATFARLHFEARALYQPFCTVQVLGYHNRFNFIVPNDIVINLVPDEWTAFAVDTTHPVSVVDIVSPQFGFGIVSGAWNVDGDPMSAIEVRGVWVELLP